MAFQRYMSCFKVAAAPRTLRERPGTDRTSKYPIVTVLQPARTRGLLQSQRAGEAVRAGQAAADECHARAASFGGPSEGGRRKSRAERLGGRSHRCRGEARGGEQAGGRESIQITGPVTRKTLLTALYAILPLTLSQCHVDLDHATTSGGPETSTHVLYDSPAIEGMVGAALKTYQELQYSGKDLNFEGGELNRKLIVEMEREPGYDVPGQTRFRILFQESIIPYTKVVFESGPFKGRVGWLRPGTYDDPRMHWP